MVVLCIQVDAHSWVKDSNLSYDGASGSEITPCNKKIDKPLVGYRFLRNVMTSITSLDIYDVHYNVVYIMTNL